MNTALCHTSRYFRLLRSRTINPRLNWTAPHFHKQTYKMASTTSTSTVGELSAKMQALGVSSIPKYPNCHPEVNVFDIYRSHITSLLVDVTGVDASIVYPALQWTNTPEKGDLLLAVPALRVKGKKPAELAAEWVEKVPLPEIYTKGHGLIMPFLVSRITSCSQAIDKPNLHPILLQGRQAGKDCHSLYPLPEEDLRTEQVSGLERPKGPIERPEKDHNRILLSKHCQTIPCWSSPKYNHWRVSGKFVRGRWLGCRPNQLSRRLGQAIWDSSNGIRKAWK